MSKRFQHKQTCNPVDGNALHPADAIGDHIFSPRLISLGPADGAQAHVYPVNGVVLWKGPICYQLMLQWESEPVSLFHSKETTMVSLSLSSVTHQRGSRCRQPERCQTLAPRRQICRLGPAEFLWFPRGPNKAGKSPYLLKKRETYCDPCRKALADKRQLASCVTFTRLLPCLEAVTGSAHAGPAGCWCGQTQLGTISIVVTTQIDTRWGEERSQRSNNVALNFPSHKTYTNPNHLWWIRTVPCHRFEKKKKPQLTSLLKIFIAEEKLQRKEKNMWIHKRRFSK